MTTLSSPGDAAPEASGGRRLRVAVVFTDGHFDYARAFAAAVARHAELLVIGPEAARGPDLDEAGADALRLLRWPRHRQVAGNLLLLARIAREVQRFGADVVHVLSEGQVWLNLLPPLVRPAAVVVTLHDVVMHPGDGDSARVPRRLVDRFVRRADAVLVHGPSLKDAAVAHLGLDPARVVVGAHPANARYRRLAESLGLRRPDDGRFRLLFFGRIFPYKGLQHLIAAEPQIAAAVPGVLTTIAGRGEDLAPYRAAMAEPARFDVRERQISDEEAAQLFTEADVLVLPYVEASQSGVLAVAAAFGLPVVASDVGEMGAMVARTGMGARVPPGNAPALARAVITLAQDPSQRARLSAASLAASVGAMGDAAVWAGASAAYGAALRTAR